MGSLFSALTTAVAGLNAQSSAIGNISDNLANAQTTGYKAVGTAFQELVNASNAAVNNPGGVRATPQYQNNVQGSITSSNTSTSLAISGSGYFAVETSSVNSSGTATFNSQTYYTRQGDFTLDKNGYLVNSSGYYLTGYNINQAGVVDTSSTLPIQISALQNNPVPASTVSYSSNLPSNAATNYTAPTSTVQVIDSLGNAHDANYTWTKTGTNTWSLDVGIPTYTDANGQPFNAIIPYTFNDGSNGTTAGTIKTIGSYSLPAPSFSVVSAPTGKFTIGNTTVAWSGLEGAGATSPVSFTVGGVSHTVAVPSISPTATPATYAANLAATLNAIAGSGFASASGVASTLVATASTNNVSIAFGGATPDAVTPDAGGTVGDTLWTAGSWAGPLATIDGTNIETPPSTYGVSTPTTSGSNANVTIAGIFAGTTTQNLTLNFGTYNGSIGVTQFSDNNSTVAVSNFSQDGLPKGSFNSISIDTNGFVSLNYSNGTNKKIDQVPIAQFDAEDHLQRVTGGAYTTTLASGNAKLSAPGVTGAGTISPNSLEQSNVDIAAEFTQLIQAQQVYTANSKLVTTDNQLLQTTINMVQ